MFSRIRFWLDCSRWYTLPMSIFSWIVIFVYTVRHGGNGLYGLIALVGICFAHLGTNLFDDYCDYKKLKKNIVGGKTELPNTQRGKCRYITDGSITLNDVLNIVFFYCFLSFCIGMFFFFSVGFEVLYFVISGGLIVLCYSYLSNRRFSELAVGMAFGPILFGGVYYVMTGTVEPAPFILSVPFSLFTVNLLYTDTYLDKNIDKNEGKKTLVSLFKTDADSLLFQKLLILSGYISICLLPVLKIADWKILIVLLTVPFAIDLIISTEMYSKNIIPEKRWYHFPFEDWEDIVENRSVSFMFRMYQARNLMIYISVLSVLALI